MTLPPSRLASRVSLHDLAREALFGYV
jgi:hypothetical protein